LPPEAASRAVQEYLTVLDDAAFGAATPVTPKFLSPADPAARWTGAHGGQAFFAYTANYLIDLDNAIIVDVEATTAIRQAEVTAAKRMIERTRDRFDLYPERLAGDSAYGSAEMLSWLVYEQGIEPHVSVLDKSARKDGTFSREDFTYDHEGDVYFCPAGKMLTTKGTLVNDGATLLYRASKHDCTACPLKPRCCPKAPARKVPRSIYEGARDMARNIASSSNHEHQQHQCPAAADAEQAMPETHAKRLTKHVTSLPVLHDKAKRHAAFVKARIFETAELERAGYRQHRRADRPPVEGQPRAFDDNCVEREVYTVGRDAKSAPCDQVAHNHQCEQAMTIGTASNEPPIDLEKRQGRRQHHGRQHQDPAGDIQSRRQQNGSSGYSTADCAGEPDVGPVPVIEVAAIRTLCPDPQGDPGQRN
jgi:hypothetical protein